MKRNRDAPFVEECWTLVGHRRGAAWSARRVRPVVGWPSTVTLDAAWTLLREERLGDVVGFFHTHPPPAFLSPSRRDVRTMRAWCGAFGKPLLCVIASGRRVAAYRFDDDESKGDPVAAVELFPRDGVVAFEVLPEKSPEGSDDDGDRQAAPRGAVPRRGRAGEAARRAGGPVRRRRPGLEPCG